MTESEKFNYSLRLGIDPHYWDQTKMDELKQLICEARLDDINLVINSEELNVDHLSKKTSRTLVGYHQKVYGGIKRRTGNDFDESLDQLTT